MSRSGLNARTYWEQDRTVLTAAVYLATFGSPTVKIPRFNPIGPSITEGGIRTRRFAAHRGVWLLVAIAFNSTMSFAAVCPTTKLDKYAAQFPPATATWKLEKTRLPRDSCKAPGRHANAAGRTWEPLNRTAERSAKRWPRSGVYGRARGPRRTDQEPQADGKPHSPRVCVPQDKSAEVAEDVDPDGLRRRPFLEPDGLSSCLDLILLATSRQPRHKPVFLLHLIECIFRDLNRNRGRQQVMFRISR
jgi:hypothetical protein